MATSRLSGFHKLGLGSRIETLREAGWIDGDTPEAWGLPALPGDVADKMIENVLGVLGMPVGLGLNFLVDGRDRIIPMAVEEPSVVAAASHAALVIRRGGGFQTEHTPPEMIAQIHLEGIDDLEAAAGKLREARTQIMAVADEGQPRMVARGGGARDVDVRVVAPFVIVHVIMDVGDAMGANAINTVAESVAPLLEELSGGHSVLRILSNLTDRRRATARCRIPFDQLDWHGFPGERVAKGVASASLCAEVDPYRAATHNKGIMNGVDAAAIALGQDWRAIESGAHAYAARSGAYRPLCTWRVDDGALVGEIDIPSAVGTVGGPIQAHPAVQALHKLAAIDGASDLGRLLACVGMASNLAALKALATEGIQRGHMGRHARSLAVAAGARGDEVEIVASALVESGEIKLWKAEEIMAERRRESGA